MYTEKRRTSRAYLRIAAVEPRNNVIDEEPNVLAFDAFVWISQEVEQLHTNLELLLYIGGRENRHEAVHISWIHCHLQNSVVPIEANA